MNSKPKYNPKIHHRHSIRLRDYDYSQEGFYFITICVKDKQCDFGKIENGKMILSEIGNIADNCWREIPQHFPDVKLGDFVIMPNHIHGIIEIVNGASVGAKNFSPLQSEQSNAFKSPSRSIGSIIRGFKIGVTKWCNQNNHSYFQWQKNYYEHIIRDGKEFKNIQWYILGNIAKWNEDEYFQ